MPDDRSGTSEAMDAPAKKAITRRSSGLLLPTVGLSALAIYLFLGTFYYPLPFGIIDTENFAQWVNTDFKYGSSPIDISVISPFQGMGGLSQPIGVWINPAYVLPRIFNAAHPRAGNFFISALLLGLVTFVLADSMKLPKFLAVICAQVIAIFSFSPMYRWLYPTGEIGINGFYESLPAFALPITTGTLFVAIFSYLGSKSTFKNVLCVILLPAVFVYSVVADSLYTAVFWVPIGVFAAGVFAASGSKRVFAWRSAGGLLCLICAAAFHIISFYRGLIKYAARGWFPNEQFVEVQKWDHFTAIIFQGWSGAIIGICILAAAITALFYGSAALRGFAGGIAAFALGMIAMSLIYVYSGIRWSLPLPNYYETGAHPAYVVALFAGGWIAWTRWPHRGPFALLDRFLKSFSPKRNPFLQYGCVLVLPLICMAGLFILPTLSGETTESVLPAKAAGVVGFLQDQIAIGGDGKFRGSVASMLGVPGGNALKPWEDKYPPDTPYEGQNVHFADTFFRDFDPHLYMSGLWSLGIPTLEDNNHVVTPAYYYLMSRALSRPQDYHPRNWNYISKIDPKLMAALGCRFLLDDRKEPDPLVTFRAEQTSEAGNSRGITIYVYELANPNTGNYSPTQTIVLNNAKQSVAMMTSPQFDFQKQAIVYEQPISVLVKADEGQFFFENGGVRVKAKSSGKSLLVIPVQFSNSLQIIERRGDATTPVTLLRVNLLETGIIFQGNLEIKFAHIFGPFRRTEGRLQDIADCIKLGIAEDGSVPYPPNFQPLAWHR